MFASTVANGSSINVHIGRNQANNASWVSAYAATLTAIPCLGTGSLAPQVNAVQRLASDGKNYFAPWVLFEEVAGLRGRAAKLFFAGGNVDGGGSVTTDPVASIYSRYTYGSDTYILLPATRSAQDSSFGTSHWGVVYYITDINSSAIIAVPYS